MFKKLNNRYIQTSILFFIIIVIFGGSSLIRNSKTIIKQTVDNIEEIDNDEIDKYSLIMEVIIDVTNSTYNNKLPGRSYFVECYGIMQTALNKKYIIDTEICYILKDHNG